MSLSCLRCHAVLLEPGPCPKCKYDNGGATSEEELKYLVLISLFQRAQTDGKIERKFIRVEPTVREAALLEHGDQCRIGLDHWRITAKGESYIYITGWRLVRVWIKVHGNDQKIERQMSAPPWNPPFEEDGMMWIHSTYGQKFEFIRFLTEDELEKPSK